MRVILLLLAACSASSARPAADMAPAPLPPAGAGQAVAVFAGGCFWCMESDFDRLGGVVSTTSGFAGGHTANPTYADVTSETTGYQEAVRVVYDTSKLTYSDLVRHYFHHIDPTDDGGQFCDRGDSYRPVIFAADATQHHDAEAVKTEIDKSGVLKAPVVVPIVEGATFYAAEVYHQDFHEKDPSRYLPYRMGCGRDARVKALWPSP
jgi:peptide-methionine (S)-S-oxide reductase